MDVNRCRHSRQPFHWLLVKPLRAGSFQLPLGCAQRFLEERVGPVLPGGAHHGATGKSANDQR
jgi:hypothetical protein